MKKFTYLNNIGNSKYIVSYYDGIKKHKDGSDFHDLRIFKSIKKRKVFINELTSTGYILVNFL